MGAYVPAAELSGYGAVVSTFGALLGFGVGIILESSQNTLSRRWAGLETHLALCAGHGTAGIWAGLRVVFPTTPLWLGLPLHFLRYLLILLWVTYFAPWVFVLLRLALADPESEVHVTL